jgi:uncharacterized LabA/DUF88 family protein
MVSKQKVIVYIDGFNFYHGIIENGWKKYLWLDLISFSQKLLRPYQELVKVRYHTSITVSSKEKRERQNQFISANQMHPKFDLQLGKMKFLNNTYIEKETDVRIAVNMIRDVIFNNCERSVLISADSDLVPVLDFISEINAKHKTIICFPPKRFSFELQQRAKKYVHLQNYEHLFRSSLFPEEILLTSGKVLTKPVSWS